MAVESADVAPVLAIERLSKTFPGTRALQDVDLTVRAGEILALLGHNGSGKSTLIKVLAGIHSPDPGSSIHVGGHRLDGHAHEAQLARGQLRFIHQDLGLVAELSAVENLALGRGFHTTRAGRIDWRAQARDAVLALQGFGLDIDVAAPVGRLSAAERSIVAIARALQGADHEGGLLVLDEPTAALTDDDAQRLFAAVRAVAARGAGVLFVSHRLHEVFEIADRVTVLRDGRLVADRSIGDIDHHELAELIAGTQVAPERSRRTRPAGAVVLRAAALRGGAVRDVSFELRAGEILGVGGLTGSGREDLAELLYGTVPAEGGAIDLPSGRFAPSDPHRSIRAGMALVPADRAGKGIVAEFSIRENITLPQLAPVLRRGRLVRRLERRQAADWLDRVAIVPPDPERRISALSGGNQQKAVIARWLRTRPAVLLLDEPTQGVDVGARATIYELVHQAAADGAAVLLCSSDGEELAGVCDRVLVLRDGVAVAELAGPECTPARILHAGSAPRSAV